MSKYKIKCLKHLDLMDYIDLYFGDASHFSTVPYIPYAWQTKERPVLLPSTRSKSLSVLGLMKACGTSLFQRTLQGSINSEVMINFLDKFCQQITKKTVIVLDNAPIHKSKMFKEKIKEWEKLDLYIYFIPPYSPELNSIEILWRFVKYKWLSFEAYTCFDSLKSHLEEVFSGFGSKYMINFK